MHILVPNCGGKCMGEGMFVEPKITICRTRSYMLLHNMQHVELQGTMYILSLSQPARLVLKSSFNRTLNRSTVYLREAYVRAKVCRTRDTIRGFSTAPQLPVSKWRSIVTPSNVTRTSIERGGWKATWKSLRSAFVHIQRLGRGGFES